MNGVEQLLAAPAPESLTDFVDFCVTEAVPPVQTMTAYIGEVAVQTEAPHIEISDPAEERLFALHPLMREATEMVDGEFPAPHELHPFRLDYRRAVTVDGSDFCIPMADARSFLDFMEGSMTFRQSLNQRYIIRGGSREDLHIDLPDLPKVKSRIDELGAHRRGQSVPVLNALASAYFWADKKFVTPSETVSEMARYAPAGLLLPMLITIEEEFPSVHANIAPLLSEYHATGRTFSNGVIWGIYPEDLIRRKLIDGTATDQTTWAAHFDEATFDEQFYAQDADPSLVLAEVEQRKAQQLTRVEN